MIEVGILSLRAGVASGVDGGDEGIILEKEQEGCCCCCLDLAKKRPEK